jgi:hypothetical protein
MKMKVAYTIFDIRPESYLWAHNICLETLYDYLSTLHPYYYCIGRNPCFTGEFSPPRTQYARYGVIRTTGEEWRSATELYGIHEFVQRFNLDRRRIALAYIEKNEQTEEICIAAMKRSPGALREVVHQTDNICREALRHDGSQLGLVQNKTRELIKLAIENNPYYAMQCLPPDLQTFDVCCFAVRKDWWVNDCIKDEDLRAKVVDAVRESPKRMPVQTWTSWLTSGIQRRRADCASSNED